QPRASRVVIRLMAVALPHWPFFDNTTDPGPEPGIGTSIMPTQADYDAFLAHPDPQRRIVMVRSEEHTSELQSRENLVCRLISENSCVDAVLHSFPTRRSSDLQPRASRVVIRLMAVALPHWPFFDNTTDPGPEPGIGTSIMPTQADYDAFLAHPDPQRRIVMV